MLSTPLCVHPTEQNLASWSRVILKETGKCSFLFCYDLVYYYYCRAKKGRTDIGRQLAVSATIQSGRSKIPSGGGLGHFKELLSFPDYLQCTQEVCVLLNFCMFFSCYKKKYHLDLGCIPNGDLWIMECGLRRLHLSLCARPPPHSVCF